MELVRRDGAVYRRFLMLAAVAIMKPTAIIRNASEII
jgi:hypothetical protein